ncbi:MAG: UDP-N-acetylmuramoyl-L-alanine--D-glutamate ligase [Rickettsiaceae bacterium]|nr:UDP-N-acetylmuramoyl-L-alanine--D-glutamate ligase [Rickettsiaceae bacterium]
MKNIKDLINFGVVGLGKTGIAAYNFLEKLGKKVICHDDNTNSLQEFVANFTDSNLRDLKDPSWRNLDAIVVSPGVPLKWPHPHPIVNFAAQYNIPIISDIDLYYQHNSSKDYIAITGTNGKSTCTALSSYIFQSNGSDYIVCGNIGDAICNQSFDHQGYILELSSFQLESTQKLKPSVALCLDITEDHLDRYKNFDDYAAAKERIFSYLLSSSHAILSIDTKATLNIFNKITLPNKIAISTNIIQDGVITAIDDKLIDNYFDHKIYTLPYNRNLAGEHNKQNITACYAIARAKNVAANQIIKAIASYKGLPHRLQYIASSGNIEFYNDSKATNNNSTQKALSSFSNIYWLAGGIAKSQNFEELEHLLGNIEKAYFFGRDKLLFANHFKDKLNYTLCENLQEAFELAYKEANIVKKQCTILLSPAAASLDQFKNFEERGQLFVNLVKSKL